MQKERVDQWIKVLNLELECSWLYVGMLLVLFDAVHSCLECELEFTFLL